MGPFPQLPTEAAGGRQQRPQLRDNQTTSLRSAAAGQKSCAPLDSSVGNHPLRHRAHPQPGADPRGVDPRNTVSIPRGAKRHKSARGDRLVHTIARSREDRRPCFVSASTRQGIYSAPTLMLQTVVVPLVSLPTIRMSLSVGDWSAGTKTIPSGPLSPAAGLLDPSGSVAGTSNRRLLK